MNLLEIAHKMIVTHVNKDHDYAEFEPLGNLKASKKLGIAPWLGVLIRMGDKVHRIQSVSKKGAKVDETLEDAILDLAIYSLLCDILLVQAINEQEGVPVKFCTYESEAAEFSRLVQKVTDASQIERIPSGFSIDFIWNLITLTVDKSQNLYLIRSILADLVPVCIRDLQRIKG